MLLCVQTLPEAVAVAEGDVQLCRVKKYGFFLHFPKSGRSGSRNHTFEKLDGILKSMGLTSTPITCESNSRIGQKLFLPDAEDAHLLSTIPLNNERSIETGVKGTPKTMNTYEFSAR